MRVKALTALLFLGLLSLAGCTYFGGGDDGEGPRITWTVSEGTYHVVAQVEGIEGRTYHWDWGDGETSDSDIPFSAHDYPGPGTYSLICIVEVEEDEGGGDEGPGPLSVGTVRLEATVVLHPIAPVTLDGIDIEPVDTPPWWHYDDGYHMPEGEPIRVTVHLTDWSPKDGISVLKVRVWETRVEDEQVWDYAEGNPVVLREPICLGAGCTSEETTFLVTVHLVLSNGDTVEGLKEFVCTPTSP